MSKIELIKIANDFVDDFKKLKISLDYTLDSLRLVEDYISSTIKVEGKPKRGTYFRTLMNEKIMGYGCYAGEVIRRNIEGVKWGSSEFESPLELSLINFNGSTGYVVNKAFKRIYEGDGDNVYHFAKIMLNSLFKSDEEIPMDFYDEEDKLIIKYCDSPICFYSNSIDLKGGIVNTIFQENNQWIFSYGNESEIEEIDDAYKITFLDYVKDKHPEFSDLIISTEKSRITRQKDGSYKTQEAHKGLFYDSHTIPSFQGNMKVNYFQWIKTHPKKTIYSVGALLISFILMLKSHWIFIIIFIGALLYNIWYWLTVGNNFSGGDVNPGKVLSLNPNLVAVATDMRKFVGDYPILKIIECNLLKEDHEIGKIIPTVALYNENPHGYPFWSEFHPVPVNLGIKNRKQIEYLNSEFSDEDIKLLNDYIEEIGVIKKGTYKINSEGSNWKDFKHVDLNKGVKMEGPIKEKNID